MSYDVYFEIDTGGDESTEVGWCNYTSNVSGMWSKALQLPEKPQFNDDGTPRMCRSYDRETKEWREEQCNNWGLGLIHEAPASEAAGILAAAVERMAASPEEYKPMEPDNGWGDYEGALEFLRWVAEMAAKHPATTIRISR